MSEERSSPHTQVLRDGGRPIAIRRAYLRVQVSHGPDKGTSGRYAGERVVIGTHPSCDVVLSDPTVSRQHCEIVLCHEGYRIRDLESTNGVYVDRVRIHEVTIERDAVLRLGGTKLVLKILDESVDLPVSGATRFGPLLGQSIAMRRVFSMLEQVAPSDMTVLITGESGTGKELAAQAIHEHSLRRDGPFRIVDCGAIPRGLIESELFGHVRGAFTGADQARRGAFADASGGTLFLDEIGELPLDMQPRLLGALERRRVIPVGASTPESFDVRVIAATNRDLRREVNRGSFREDLFFRLAVAVVDLPPLRERPEDIPLYVDEHFAGEAQLDADTLARLSAQRGPGNVRELHNALERAALVGHETDVTAQRS
jgi:transcriptional regulator with PAS, ATPase and Fis domain